MTEITKSITFLNEYKQLKKALEEGKTPVLAVGLAAIHKANLAAALGADLKRPVLVLTDDGIVEEGDHDQLMEQKGIYYQFYETANALK